MRLRWWCAFVLALLASAARAEVPFAVNQQGLLVDTAGVPMNGSVDLFFRVWAHPTSSAPADLVYQELHLDRPVVDGVYEAVLGTGSFPAPAFSPALFASPNRWLEIQVEAETLTPRQKILAVPYALQAQVCELAARADEADQAQTLNGFDESDFQGVVTGSCPAGQSIRAIAQNGTVTCELDDFNLGDITGVTAGTGLAGGAASGNATLSIAASGVTSALLADGTITNADVAAAAAIAPTKIAGIAATRTFVDEMEFNGTLYIVTANGGRVGIDTDAPEEKLDIQGNVRAGAFRFATPQTSYISIDAVEFNPRDSGLPYETTGGGRYSTSGTTSFFKAPVHLPDGAQFVEFGCRVLHTSGGQTSVTLYRRDGAGETPFGGFFANVDPNVQEITTSVTPLIVDNRNASYLLSFIACGTDDCALSRCWVGYTRTQAD